MKKIRIKVQDEVYETIDFQDLTEREKAIYCSANTMYSWVEGLLFGIFIANVVWIILI